MKMLSTLRVQKGKAASNLNLFLIAPCRAARGLSLQEFYINIKLLMKKKDDKQF
jgi:hypothetical protein